MLGPEPRWRMLQHFSLRVSLIQDPQCTAMMELYEPVLIGDLEHGGKKKSYLI